MNNPFQPDVLILTHSKITISNSSSNYYKCYSTEHTIYLILIIYFENKLNFNNDIIFNYYLQKLNITIIIIFSIILKTK